MQSKGIHALSLFGWYTFVEVTPRCACMS